MWSLDDILKLFTVLGVLLTVFVSLFTATQAASKSGFDQLKEIVDRLQKQVDELQAENDDLRSWVEALVEQVEEAGLTPVPFRHKSRVRK